MTAVNRRPPFRFNLIEELEEINHNYMHAKEGKFFEKHQSLFIQNYELNKYYKLYILWGVYFFTYFGMNFSLF